MSKRVLVLGAGGFIGGHLVKRLMDDGHEVTSVDIKMPEFRPVYDSEKFIKGDLRVARLVDGLMDDGFDEVFQLAADMGGAGFVFTGENDADIMHNSAVINLNVLDAISRQEKKPRVFYSSSACIYPERNQLDPINPVCSEDSAYPAAPDSEYGWEKLFSERLYASYAKNKNIEARIARFHNIFGPNGTYEGGREKAPAALCRKVAQITDGGEIEIWGDGKQTRSFLYVDECVEGILRLMASDVTDALNIGSEEMVTIDQLAEMIISVSGKKITLKHIPGPQGVRGRSSDNKLIQEKLNWKPTSKLLDGLKQTYSWIDGRVRA
jgi:nucleoside-diphosphate-sugar epimerase